MMMHINSMKDITKDKEIIILKDPEIIKIPLIEKFGGKPKPIVHPGEHVKRYQLIAKSEEDFSDSVHSPVSGTVQKIETIKQVDDTEALTIFIRNDGQDSETQEPLGDIKTDTPDEILELIVKAGIVGLGGAQFPTAKKYDRKDKDVRTFIINGAECEPYLTADFALMKHHAPEILEAIAIIDRVLDAEEIVIAFEKTNQELEDVFGPLLNSDNYKKITTRIVPDEYPQGGELQLAKTITGIEITKGDIPLDYGIIVSNVETVYAVYNATVNGKPLTERIITISGERVAHPGNYRVKIGTPVEHVLECCEVNLQDTVVISGGPMMSPQIIDLSAPLHKGSLGLLALPKKHIDRIACIWCGYCVDVCPMNLMPMQFHQFYKKKQYVRLSDYDINDCIECGACEYICPSNVPLLESITEGKNILKEK
ncbi:MAG: electron transport complex subunit RsxC [Bacteroides sp.]|nr:electron transport complex subunit RsxC [Bacteroides sp.]